MSPSESQLRAALHEGEGQGVDAGLVIFHARRVQRERSRRRMQLVAASLVVGVVGAGFTLLGGSGGSGGGSSAVSEKRNSVAAGGTGGAGGAGGGLRPAAGSSAAASRAAGGVVPTPRHQGDYAAAGCPRVPDRITLPEGVTRDDASGPLLPSDAAAILACAYPSGTRSRSVVLRSTAATALASTVNAATLAPTHSVRTCTKDELVGTVELLAVDGVGKHARPVLVTVACPETVATNGTATRYFAVAPEQLSHLLR